MAEAGKLEGDREGEGKGDDFLEGTAVLDFDMLCASVASRTQGMFSGAKMGEGEDEKEHGGEFSGGVQRMWEGEIFDCFEDRRIAIQTMCCPCYRFGKNMGRAGFGSCFLQGTVYLVLAVTALVNYIFFIITKRHSFLYLAIAFTISLGTYVSLFRTQIRKQFNIRANDRSFDDCVYHIVCPCCALCQESRTLEINNVRDGFWSGRSETICIGRYGEGSKGLAAFHLPHSFPGIPSPVVPAMERCSTIRSHSWNIDINHSEPLVRSSIDSASRS